MEPRIIEFKEFGDDRGKLVVAESEANIPFTMRRSFWIYGSDYDTIRGNHANKYSEFVLVCVSGACRVKTVDCHGVLRDYVLDSPLIGLYVPKMTWKEMYAFSDDAVLLVLASKPYDATEYIREYDEWESLRASGKK